MAWQNSLQSFIWIFPVGRGNSAFVRTGLNHGFLVDMAGGEFEDPAAFVRQHFLPHLDKYRKRGIAQVILSHPHVDHIAQCGELEKEDLSPALLTCPHDKTDEEGIDWTRICNPAGTEQLVATYRTLFASRQLPLQTICYESTRFVPNLEYGIFWVRPPVCHTLHPEDDNEYGNATSVVFYVRQGKHSILLPGDITPVALDEILADGDGVEKRLTRFADGPHPGWHDGTVDQPSLRDLLGEHGLSVLVAPHHGLESCYSTSLYDAIRGGKPRLVVISERRHRHENDGQTDSRYTNGCGGSGLRVTVDGELQDKTYVSTVRGHHIVAVFPGTGQPRVYADTKPDALLRVLSGL